MNEFRFQDKHISNASGMFTYQTQQAIGEGVVIQRNGVVDIELGVLKFHEMNMTVEGFDKVYYHFYTELPRINEATLISMLRRHYY